MKLSFLIPAACCLAVALSSCDGDGNKSGSSDPATIEWKRIEVHKEYTAPEVIAAFPNDSIGSTFHADFVLLLPQFSDGSSSTFLAALTDSLLGRLPVGDYPGITTPNARLEKHVEGLLERHKSIIADSAEDMANYGYSGAFIESYSMVDSLIFDKGGLVSLLGDLYQYTGGIHGMYAYLYTNIDFHKEAILTADSLFMEGSEPQINELILRKLMQIIGVTEPEELEENEAIDYKRAVMIDNFFIDEKGITFVYNIYEIAPYAVGAIMVGLPYADLAPYLREEYAFLAK